MAKGNNGRGGGRGRGRGDFRGGGKKGGMKGAASIADELDFTVQMYADAQQTASTSGPAYGRGARGGGNASTPSTPGRGRGRGRGGRGGYDFPFGGRGRGRPEASTPRRGDWGIGASPRGRGGRGAAGAYTGRPTTLSGLLYQERPLLRPIVFVPSVLSRVLFQEEEELLKPGVEDVDDTEQSHIPTADKVARVFSGDANKSGSESSDDDDEEEIEEVDFNEVSKLFDASASTTTTTIRKSKLADSFAIEEQRFTGFYTDLEPTPVVESHPTEQDVEDLTRMMEETLSATEDVQIQNMTVIDAASNTNNGGSLFCIDVNPTPVPASVAPAPGLKPSALRSDDEDDVIVYVAPHPRQSISSSPMLAKNSVVDAPPQHEDGEVKTVPDTSAFTPYVSVGTTLSTAISSTAAAAVTEKASTSESPLSPAPQVPTQPFSFSFPGFGTDTPAEKRRLTVPPVSTPRQAKAWRRKRGLAVGKVQKRGKTLGKSSFGSFGAMREEEEIHRKDPQKHERRRGDSDLEWGTDEESNEDDEEVHGAALAELLGNLPQGNAKGKGRAIDNGGSGMDMEIDPDVQLDPDAMRRFVGGLLGSGAGTHVTMGDVDDAQAMREEDEEIERLVQRMENGEGSSEEDEDHDREVDDEGQEGDILAVEEAMMVDEALEFDESESDDSDDSDDGDEDQTPRTSFQARLERLRAKSREVKQADTSMEGMNIEEDSEGEEEGEGDLFTRNITWAEDDENFIQEIQDILDENEDILTGRDRKNKKKLFRSINNGDFDDFDDFGFAPATRRKDKGKHLPADLASRWEADRARKAELKRERAAAKLAAAADPLIPKRSGKKARAAIRAAASLDPTIHVLPNRIIDLTTLVQQIRRFIADVGGPRTMALPPTNKETRKNVHELALAFNLTSVSKGKGDSRYTTLSKTTRSGVRVDEAKIGRIVRRAGGAGSRGDAFVSGGAGRARNGAMPRHREGDEVGKAAPKLTQANVGFRMLALMGWSEGTKIGVTGQSLDAPLTAIIKTTKLGLGATK